MSSAASHLAITALIHAYAERLDAGDLAGVGALFAHATYRSSRGGTYRGADEVATVLQRLVLLHPDGTPRTKHVLTNLTIEVDDVAGAATARSYFTVLQQTERIPLQIVVAGRYHDRFERVDGVWRFADRLIHGDLLGTLTDHLRDSRGLARS